MSLSTFPHYYSNEDETHFIIVYGYMEQIQMYYGLRILYTNNEVRKKTYREFGHKHVERTLKMNKINLEDSDKLTIILSKILLLDEDDILFWGKNEEEK
jgi:hypothetical protein